MEGVIVCSVLVHTLSYKQALLAGVVLLPLVVDFYVLLDDAVLITPEGTPGTDAVEILLLDPRREVQ